MSIWEKASYEIIGAGVGALAGGVRRAFKLSEPARSLRKELTAARKALAEAPEDYFAKKQALRAEANFQKAKKDFLTTGNAKLIAKDSAIGGVIGGVLGAAGRQIRKRLTVNTQKEAKPLIGKLEQQAAAKPVAAQMDQQAAAKPVTAQIDPQAAAKPVAAQVDQQAAPPPAKKSVAYRDENGSVHFKENGPVVLGRSNEPGIITITGTNGKVSRSHAQVTQTDSRLSFEDLGSLNGTWLNGIRQDRGDLQVGDILTLGPKEGGQSFKVMKKKDGSLFLSSRIPLKEVLNIPDRYKGNLSPEGYQGLISGVEDGLNHIMQGRYEDAAELFANLSPKAGIPLLDELPLRRKFVYDPPHIQDEGAFLNWFRQQGYMGNYCRANEHVRFNHIIVLTKDNIDKHIPGLRKAGFSEGDIAGIRSKLAGLSAQQIARLNLLQKKNAYSGFEEWYHALQYHASPHASGFNPLHPQYEQFLGHLPKMGNLPAERDVAFALREAMGRQHNLPKFLQDQYERDEVMNGLTQHVRGAGDPSQTRSIFS